MYQREKLNLVNQISVNQINTFWWNHYDKHIY